jgi:hypothetical protein
LKHFCKSYKRNKKNRKGKEEGRKKKYKRALGANLAQSSMQPAAQ